MTTEVLHPGFLPANAGEDAISSPATVSQVTRMLVEAKMRVGNRARRHVYDQVLPIDEERMGDLQDDLIRVADVLETANAAGYITGGLSLSLHFDEAPYRDTHDIDVLVITDDRNGFHHAARNQGLTCFDAMSRVLIDPGKSIPPIIMLSEIHDVERPPTAIEVYFLHHDAESDTIVDPISGLTVPPSRYTNPKTIAVGYGQSIALAPLDIIMFSKLCWTLRRWGDKDFEDIIRYFPRLSSEDYGHLVAIGEHAWPSFVESLRKTE